MLAVAACLYFLRSRTFVTAPAFWAEDGTVFFKDAIERGWGALFTPYAGQLFLLQRAIASVLAPLPASIQPALFAVAAMAVAVLSCGIVISPRWRDAVPVSSRFACLVALLCAPGVDETYGTLANAAWWLGIGLVLLGMLRDPLRRWGRVGEIGFAALAGTSGFVALYGIPTLGVRAIRNRSRHSVTVLGVALLGIGVQIGFLLGSTRRGDVADIFRNPVIAVLVFVKRVIATAALGETSLSTLWPQHWPGALAAVVVIVLVTALAVIWVRGARIEIGALVLSLTGGWFLALWAMTLPGASLEMLLSPGAAARYFLVPKALLYIGLVASRPLEGISKAMMAVVSVLLVWGVLSGYHLAHSPAVGWGSFARCVDQTQGICSTVIPPGWLLEVTGRGR